MTDTPHPHRRRLAVVSLCSALAVLLLSLAGIALWQRNSQWGPPTFHESWSPEERTALTEFDTYLRDTFSTELLQVESLFSDATADSINKTFCTPIRKQLRAALESGNGSTPAISVPIGHFSGDAPAIIASQTGHLGALKALISHGANPNACITTGSDEESDVGDTCMSCLLSGSFGPTKKKIPWSERKEMAEYLLAHGADLNTHSRIIGICCTLASMRGESEPWFWALEHGKKVSGRELVNALNATELQLPLIEAMLHSTPEAANATDYEETPLQALAKRVRYAEAEEMPELENVLDLLLAHGASPTLRPEENGKNDFPERRLPLDIMMEKQNFDTCGMSGEGCEGEADSARAIWQRMCNKLQQ